MQNGKVILAGAGPGDPELITVKAARYLQKAEVILTDRLVSEEILSLFANTNAEIIRVGKQHADKNSIKQESINELMVKYALQGRMVVRLKGGDVSVFSNILDELQTLNSHGIPYEIIPGITAALGAAAYAGIPLTARNYSTSVRFLTHYNPDVLTNDDWKELAKTDDTLVFYMSSGATDDVVNKLTKHEISADKLIAVVEQATTPFQKVTIANLYDYSVRWTERDFISPSLLIIGKVVGLHAQFQWMSNHNESTGSKYFRSVNEAVHNEMAEQKALIS